MALLALTLQLGLSFGHVHGLRAGGSAALTAIADIGNVPTSRPDTDDPGHDDYCAICAILALLTGAQTASAPIVAPPVALASAEISLAPEALRVVAQRAPFSSRAPPIS